jgi:DNA-binding GntR family transcriptional regulator
VIIDPHSHVPIYLQIADAVRAAMAAGVYRPGESLPSLDEALQAGQAAGMTLEQVREIFNAAVENMNQDRSKRR